MFSVFAFACLVCVVVCLRIGFFTFVCSSLFVCLLDCVIGCAMVYECAAIDRLLICVLRVSLLLMLLLLRSLDVVGDNGAVDTCCL